MSQKLRRLNCWEYRMCGREPGGLMIEVLGPCPVPVALKLDGVNAGQAAGRACWLVAGSTCAPHRSDGQSGYGCHRCEFYHRVIHEEEGRVQATFSAVRS